MRAEILIIATVLMIECPATEAAAQSQPARTVDITIACPKDQDFDRYATLLLDISAAVLYKNDHDCVTLPKGMFVRVDQGSVERDFSHDCIRPVGSYDCFGHMRVTSRSKVHDDIVRRTRIFGAWRSAATVA